MNLVLISLQAARQGNLWKAAAAGNVDRIRALVEAGALVDGTNEYGQTAVYLSTLHSHQEAVELLLRWEVVIAVKGFKICGLVGKD